MAIVRVLGRPTYFVTFTCNPDWPEIRAALLPGQDAQSRPDLVARVFGQKLRALLEELTKRGIFGRCVAILMVIEFQKRGKSDQNLSFFYNVGATDLAFLSQSSGISTHSCNYIVVSIRCRPAAKN